MKSWSLSFVWFIDFTGSFAMIVVSSLCLAKALKIIRKTPENALANYLLWFTGAIFAFSLSRSIGHIIKHMLYFYGYSDLWKHLSPISGSINSITFVVIGAVTLYFRQMETIMKRMTEDRDKISSFSQELLELNKDIETIVSERTRIEMGLRFAHKIRNPSMIIGGLAQRLKKNFPDNTPEKEHLKKIQEQSEKLELLVGKIEQPVQAKENMFSPQELNTLVEDSINAVQDEANIKGVIILLFRSPHPLIFQGNRHFIKISLMHILRNSIEACENGDTIQVITEAGENSVKAIIEDNGPGIPQDIVNHIFEPFVDTNEGMTGIGLSYVKQIIEEHNGSIDLSSRFSEGTSVEITFPHLLGELSKEI